MTTTTMVIRAPRARVWRALVDPDAIRAYLPVDDVRSEWRAGSAIAWTAELMGRRYDVTGTITRVEPGQALAYRFTDPIARRERAVRFELADAGDGTSVTVTEEGHRTGREREHAEGAWRLVAANLKALLER